MGLGEISLGEMGLGEMGQNRSVKSAISEQGEMCIADVLYLCGS